MIINQLGSVTVSSYSILFNVLTDKAMNEDETNLLGSLLIESSAGGIDLAFCLYIFGSCFPHDDYRFDIFPQFMTSAAAQPGNYIISFISFNSFYSTFLSFFFFFVFFDLVVRASAAFICFVRLDFSLFHFH